MANLRVESTFTIGVAAERSPPTVARRYCLVTICPLLLT
jgi:hypothetical protein